MTINRIPGFDAENSIYQSVRIYSPSKTRNNPFVNNLGKLSLAAINIGGIDCSNCVGAECAELRCFENWTHSGGGSEGPYIGGDGERNYGGFPIGGRTRMVSLKTYCCGTGANRRCISKYCPSECPDFFATCPENSSPILKCCSRYGE